MTLPQTLENVRADRQKDRAIEDLFFEGMTVPQIAEALGFSNSQVWSRLTDMGHDTSENSYNGIWGLPEEDRRRAIARRAAKGAKEALRGFESFKTIGELSSNIVAGLGSSRE